MYFSIYKKKSNLFIGKKETKSILQNKPGSVLLFSIRCCLLFFSMTLILICIDFFF